MDGDDLPGLLRRIRRCADLSQRQLAAACGTSQSSIARAESGRGDLPTRLVLHAARLAGLRVALVDGAGREVPGMAEEAVRDQGGRRYPAHLDTRYGDLAWWHGEERYSRDQPWYTFDRVREWRDHRRDQLGTPSDHQLPQPGDSPRDRREARRSEAWRAREAAREEFRRRLLEEGTGGLPDPWTCECPPGCDATREVLAEVHVEGCPCRCDLA